MLTVAYTDLSPLLLRLAQRLIDRKVIPPLGVWVTAKRQPRDVAHLTGERDVTLRFGRERNTGTDQGGGEWDTRSETILQAVVRTRCESDEAGSDRVRLTDGSLGHYPFRAAVRAAIHLFFVDNVGTSDLLTVEPVHWLDASDAEPDAKDPNWLSSVLQWQVVYAVDLPRPSV